MISFDATTGARLWQQELPQGCEPSVWTGAGTVVVPPCASDPTAADGGAALPVLRIVNAETGTVLATWTSPDATPAPAPGLCEGTRTECRVVTVAHKTWLLGADGSLWRVPDLERGAQLAGERVIYQTGVGVAARRLTDPEPLWSWQGRGELISADSAGVYLLTTDRTVLQLSPATGHLAAIGCASAASDERWQLGHIYPTGTGTYLALERINRDASATADDQAYYFGPRPIALVELYPPTKLPIWPGKFAACAPV
jgi:hypothetical protein